ncbi:MAG: protein kinase [Deltaproteobacteria bacterium]|nr:protein kinase [Deltaproteobacteria bacterium]
MPEAPTRLGRYLLEERIGHGGMAEVFRARIDEGAFQKPVCIKRILPQLAGQPGFVTMFRDEAALAARLSHANIVQVLDFGEADGTLFMSLELIDGVPLDRALTACRAANARLPVPVALHIAVCMCRALHAAHVATADGRPLEIVHRDVSPHNVLLGRDGSVKLGDFGIARAVERLTRTNTGVVKGKPSYMAPEQALAERCDHRVDQFATAVVVWEMLSGTALFRGKSALAVIEAVVRAEVPPIDRPDVDAELTAVLRRALARQPGDRFPDMATLERELEATLVRMHATPSDIDVRPVVARTLNPAPRTVVDAEPTEEDVVHALVESTSSSGVWQALGPGSAPPQSATHEATSSAATPAPERANAIVQAPPASSAPSTPAAVPAAVVAARVQVIPVPRVTTPAQSAGTRPLVAGAILGCFVLAFGFGAVLVLGRASASTPEVEQRPALCPASARGTGEAALAREEREEGTRLLANDDVAGARFRFEDALRRDPLSAEGYLLFARALGADDHELRAEALACVCAVDAGSAACRHAEWLASLRSAAWPPFSAEGLATDVAGAAPGNEERSTTTASTAGRADGSALAPAVTEPADSNADPHAEGASAARLRAAGLDEGIKEARTLYLQGKYERAADVLTPLTRTHPNDPVLWKLLGMSAQKQGKLRTMCRAYGELLRLQPFGIDAAQAQANRQAGGCR